MRFEMHNMCWRGPAGSNSSTLVCRCAFSSNHGKQQLQSWALSPDSTMLVALLAARHMLLRIQQQCIGLPTCFLARPL
jgi:hypothetical protein